MKCKVMSWIVVVLFIQNSCAEPLLVTVLMVKNEASVIEATLQPYVDGGVKEFVIFDTGSTDGTREVVTHFFERHNIKNVHIVEEPFIDFSTSRNHALDSAQAFFPRATFMLMPDAEWYMHNVEGLLQFCADHQDDFQASYLVPIRSTTDAFFATRLLRCRTGIRFVGAVHEALNQLTYVTLPDAIYFEWRPSLDGNKKSAQRWQRDRDLLLKSYEENPHDPRTLFYLGQTYGCLGDWETAYEYYEKRAEICGWDEENFITRMRLGDIAQQIAQKDGESISLVAIGHYLKAFSMRPHRAEPLIKIAQYYLDKGEMHLAFLFASRAVHIPYPAQDILFIEKYMYDFVRYDILGISAWYVGEYDLGEWAARQALQVKPDAEYLQRNLQFYTDRRNS